MLTKEQMQERVIELDEKADEAARVYLWHLQQMEELEGLIRDCSDWANRSSDSLVNFTATEDRDHISEEPQRGSRSNLRKALAIKHMTSAGLRLNQCLELQISTRFEGKGE